MLARYNTTVGMAAIMVIFGDDVCFMVNLAVVSGEGYPHSHTRQTKTHSQATHRYNTAFIEVMHSSTGVNREVAALYPLTEVVAYGPYTHQRDAAAVALSAFEVMAQELYPLDAAVMAIYRGVTI